MCLELKPPPPPSPSGLTGDEVITPPPVSPMHVSLSGLVNEAQAVGTSVFSFLGYENSGLNGDREQEEEEA